MKGKILKEEIVHDGWGRYSKLDVEYTSNDGFTNVLQREVQDSGHGAAIILYNRSRRSIILVRQFRIGAYVGGHHDGLLLECVAGLVEKGEDAKNTICREVAEETGMVIDKPTFLFEGYASPGAKTEKIYFFSGEYCGELENKHGGNEDENEDIEIVEMSISQAWQLVKEGGIQDCKTIVLIQHLLLHIFAGIDI